MKSTVYVFPGQGSHRVGMGRDFVRSSEAARTMLERAERLTGMPLGRLMLRGPLAELTDTRAQQPAICVAGAMAIAVMGEAGVPAPEAAAGHSLGELTACYAAGVLEFDALVTLAAERGRLMQAAADARPGGMIAVAPVDDGAMDDLLQATGNGDRIALASRNAPDEIVLSGDLAALSDVETRARQIGLRTNWLQVSGPWHSAAMAPAAEAFARELSRYAFREARIPVCSTLDPISTRDPDRLKRCLADQISTPVDWERTVRRIRADWPDARIVEVGCGKVLTGLILRIDPRSVVQRVEDASTLAKFRWSLGQPSPDDHGRAAQRR